MGHPATRRASATRSRRGPGRRAARRPPPATVGPSAAATRSGVATADDHRERHPPDVARRRRVRGVEVAVRVEPGDRRGGCRVGPDGCRPSPPAWVVQSPPSTSSARVGRCVAERRGRCGRPAAGDTRRSAPGSSPAGRDPAPSRGRWRRRPSRAGRSPPDPGRAAQAGHDAEPPELGRRSLHARRNGPRARSASRR